jgi:BirA family biotin operon repressor/biotin-[acetyl-CoA-carboxylase] ligase
MYGARFEVRHFEELDSTNRYLIDEARAGAPEGLVAVADHQTAGRGRLGRRWEAPAGANLLVSVLLRPTQPIEELHLCTLSMALAARSACAAATGIEPTLKWPNDLMVGERKLAGILAEAIPDGEHGRAVVVGIGLNLAWPPPDTEPGDVAVPDELAHATSLWRESGTRVEPGDLLGLLLDDLDRRLEDLARPDGRRRLASEYRSVCTTLGRPVTVSLGHETVTGIVSDITIEGHLLVDVGACIRTITAGDVVHLRT